MTSRANFIKTLNHKQPDKLVVDFGATTVTGIHVLMVKKLREHFGLERRPVKAFEPFQMLGEIEDDLAEAMGVDVVGIFSRTDKFGHSKERWKAYRTNWGQEVLVPAGFNTTIDENGDTLIYPHGDSYVAPCAKMPKAAYFFDAVNRQGIINDDDLNPADNLEEFALFNPEDIAYWRESARKASRKGMGIVANFGGTSIGDIATVPGLSLKNPKGIRDVADWYMSILMRSDYLHQVFEKQTDIALENLKRAKEATGNLVDVVYICGTDFGTQNSAFCSIETFRELYAPYYKKMNDWIHENTNWKTFKHSCGAIEPFLESFIEAGFDIINPVQVNATGMDPLLLKEKYGAHLVFWGGGADTQKILPFGRTEQVKEHVLRECEIFAPQGGFVFNAVHNIQANVPLTNVVAMLEAIREL